MSEARGYGPDHDVERAPSAAASGVAVTTDDRTIDTVSLLAEPVRRALYEHVARAATEVSRDEAARACGVSRSLAAFHLDKLVAAGLLAVAYRRLSGRTGPGAGRPAKLYRRGPGEFAVTLPPRAYDLAAHLLAEVVGEAGLEPRLYAAARRAGRAAGAAAGGSPGGAGTAGGGGTADGVDLEAVLAERGYGPYRDGREVRLRNCPFHTLAAEHPPLVCGMNLALLEGLVGGLAAGGGGAWAARLDPRPGDCCVVLASKSSKS
jgi:predicted ArsR family transcriptional regulator